MPLKNTKNSLKKRHGIRREMSGSNSWKGCPPNEFPLLSDFGAVVGGINTEYQIVAQDIALYKIAHTESHTHKLKGAGK